MTTETISFLKKNVADLPVDEPLVITQNGKPKYVIESYEESKRRDESLALMKMVMIAKNDKTAGRVQPVEELEKRLSERRQRLADNE